MIHLPCKGTAVNLHFNAFPKLLPIKTFGNNSFHIIIHSTTFLSNMPRFFYDSDADLSIIRNKKVAFVGYGNQGRATLQLTDLMKTTYKNWII